MGNEGGGFSAFIPLILMTVPMIFICRRLAKDKGKDVSKYTILGCIPLLNFYILAYLVGTPNLILDKKLDQILSILEKTKSSEST